MKKKSTYGLKPEQLERLLSIGSEGANSEGTTSKDKADQTDAPSYTSQAQPLIEGYEILGKLGEAGQGQIWRALQFSTNRQVALKVPKAGLISSEKALARFEREVELTAALKHANIAQIHDSGIHQGIYYYAMDLVEGTHLDEYVKHHDLTIRQILELMKTICEAIQHAHQSGIIHRDLKPSNIIVTEDGRPYIVDFGLAKNLLEDGLAATVSLDGEVAGTPAYMSPEQAAGRLDKLDTRTDVYSLGAMLFTLLTGESPHDLSGSRYEVMRRIAEERVRRPHKTCPKISKELELLLLKALDNEPDRRYAAAGILAQDIDNYLTGAPLFAAPQSSVYQLKKFMKRHRALVAGITAVLSVLVAGIVVSTVFAIKADYARAEAQAVSDFLRHSVLASLDPFKVKGREITIRSVWDAASESLEGEFQGTLLAEAEIHDTLGNGYWSLGLYEQAELHLKRAWDIQQAQRGPEHPAAVASAHQLGWVYFAQSLYPEAEQFLAHASNTRHRLLGEEHEDTVYSTTALACVYTMQGRFQQAEELLVKTLEITRRVLGEEHPHVPATMNAMAWGYELQGRYAESEELARRGLRIARRVLGENDWFALLLKHTIARTCILQGSYDEAEEPLQQVLKGRREAWGQGHPDTLETMISLGSLYCSKGLYEEAEMQFNQVLEDSRRILGDSHFITAECMYEQGTLYLSQGKYDEAGPLLEEALKIADHILGEENWFTLLVMNRVGKLHTAQGRYDEAERLFGQSLMSGRHMLGREHPHTLDSVNGLALLRMKQGHFDDANNLFHEALDGRRSKLGADHPDTLESKNDLAMLCKEQGHYAEAEPLLLEAVDGRRLKLGDTHPHTLNSVQNLIELYEAWGKPERLANFESRMSN